MAAIARAFKGRNRLRDGGGSHAPSIRRALSGNAMDGSDDPGRPWFDRLRLANLLPTR